MSSPVITVGDLVLDGMDGAGVRWALPKDGLTGWWGSPAPRMSSSPRPGAHGVVVGQSWLEGKTVGLDIWMTAPDRARALDALARFTAACSLDSTTLRVDDEVSLSTQVVRSDDVLSTWSNLHEAKFSVQFLAADPRLTKDPLTGSTGLPSSSGGLSIPFTVPFSIDSNVSTGQVSLTNAGNIAGKVQLRIDGPVVGPIVTHVSSGVQIVFASSLELGEGEWITVDMDRREVLAQGQADRGGWVTGRGWSSFEPGVNVWAFGCQGSSNPDARLTVTAWPSWM